MTPEELLTIVNYYVQLLIVQYHDKPNAQATIALYVNEIIANGIFFAVRDGFDLNTAVGPQLDILGKYIGVDRAFEGQTIPDNTYFSFCDYFTTPESGQLGFSTYNNYDTVIGRALLYNEILSQTQLLSDTEYLILLKLAIIRNNCNSSNSAIDAGLFSLFNANIFTSESGTMKMTYFVTLPYYAIANVAYQKGVLPKPMGVQIQDLVLFNNPYFAFGDYFTTEYTTTITGFTTYSDYDMQPGLILTYNEITHE